MQHKLRSLLSTLGIMFAVGAVISMLAVAEGAKRETLKQISQLGMNTVIIRPSMLTDAQKIAARSNLSKGLAYADVVSMKRLAGVLFIAPVKEVRAGVSGAVEENHPDILCVTPAYQYVKNLVIKQGRFICDEDVVWNNLVCVLGKKVSLALGGRIGKVIYLENRPYKIVGILEERRLIKGKIPALSVRDFNNAVFIPYGTEIISAQASADSGEFSEIFVKLSPGTDVHGYARAIERILLLNHGEFKDFQVVVPEELIRQAWKTQRIFNIVLGCIAGISLLVGGIGIMNIMIASVSERTKEIGIRRAIGADREHIILQFLSEAVILTFMGGLIGVGLGCIGVFVITVFAGWMALITPWSVLAALSMSVFVGVFFGIYPAYRAAVLDPISALRQE
ncbi:MAG: FtsX-like permease family protein [Desulfobacteraceae bacterium]|nr:FtsX-like permease family protein [Desulfobacteraceae bacterium]